MAAKVSRPVRSSFPQIDATGQSDLASGTLEAALDRGFAPHDINSEWNGADPMAPCPRRGVSSPCSWDEAVGPRLHSNDGFLQKQTLQLYSAAIVD